MLAEAIDGPFASIAITLYFRDPVGLEQFSEFTRDSVRG